MASTTANAPQNMGQSPFFYYNPEPHADHRQHGHFTPQPKQDGVQAHQLQQQWYHQQMMYYGQPPMMYPQLPSSVPTMHQKSGPPMTTPRPIQHRPAALYQFEGKALAVDTDCNSSDVNMFPSTPALSSGSVVSSPPSTCGVLPTPTTDSYMGLEGVKEGCHGDVSSELLASGDLIARSGSPILTPGM